MSATICGAAENKERPDPSGKARPLPVLPGLAPRWFVFVPLQVAVGRRLRLIWRKASRPFVHCAAFNAGLIMLPFL